VAGPEALLAASAAGTLVPLLTLGLPTSATAAIMLAAFQQYGLQPGPQLFDHNPALVWGMIASLFIGNTMLLVLNLPLAPVWAKLLRIPRPYLYAGIVMFAALGVYALNASAVDLVVLYLLGVLGFAMRRFGLPVAPAVIGMILGPMAEIQLRRALAIGAGDVGVLVRSPIAVTLLVLSALALLTPLFRKALARRTGGPSLPVSRED
jgi:putative tricarboxylic transport membrane protein